MATRKLASNRSPNWAFIERFEVPNYDSDGNYLTRWRIIQTPWFGWFLHRFDGPDPRTTLHDHPWPFVSFVLKGGYLERRLDPNLMVVNECHLVRRVNYLRIGEAHAIVKLKRRPTWTLMLVGRRRRIWGYWEPVCGASRGQWAWTPFDRHRHNDEFLAAMERRNGNP